METPDNEAGRLTEKIMAIAKRCSYATTSGEVRQYNKFYSEVYNLLNEELPTKEDKPPNWPIQSFDGEDWAREFCRIIREEEGIAIDFDFARAWFQNALMRGFDEHAWRLKRNAETVASGIEEQGHELRKARADKADSSMLWTPLDCVLDAYSRMKEAGNENLSRAVVIWEQLHGKIWKYHFECSRMTVDQRIAALSTYLQVAVEERLGR